VAPSVTRETTLRRLSLLPAIACVALGSGAGAQDTTGTAASDARCDSVVAAARADNLPSGLFLALKRVDGGELATEQITDMLAIVGAGFTAPKPFRLTVFSGPVLTPGLRRLTASGAPVLRTPTLTGAYRVKGASDGAFTSLETIRASLMPGFDSAAVEAIRLGGATPGLFAPRDGTPSTTVDFRFSTDSVGAPGWTVRRLVSVTFPRMPVTDAALQTADVMSGLPSRDSLHAETVLRFVVDRTGEPIMETLEIVRGNSLEFVRAALTALGKTRFAPARIQGCAVAQLIELPFAVPPLNASGTPPSSDGPVRY
jgi:hypothetical protein